MSDKPETKKESNGRLSLYILDDSEVVKGYQKLNPELQTYYILMAVSGARSSHFFKAFKEPVNNRKIEYVSKSDYSGMRADIVRMDIRKFAEKGAYAEYIYFPAKLENAVRNFTLSYLSNDYYQKNITKLQDEDFCMNVSSLRLWQYETMSHVGRKYIKPREKHLTLSDLKKYKADLNIVQGYMAVSDDIDSLNFEERAMRGAVAYSYSAEHFVNVMNIPDFILKGEVSFRPKLSKAEEEEREKKVVEMLKAVNSKGKFRYSHREIMRDTGITSRPLNTIIEKYGLERKEGD